MQPGGSGSIRRVALAGFVAGVVLALPGFARSIEPEPGVALDNPAAGRGYENLTRRAYLPPDFDDELFSRLWTTWEEPLRSEAERADPATRRRMAFARYGLDEAPAPGRTALQYADDGGAGWVMNCFACHGGSVDGRVIPGLPNSRYDLQTLTEEVRSLKVRLGKPLGHMDLGSLAMPLSGVRGGTNAVMFGKVLLSHRDAELGVHSIGRPIQRTDHDHDPPPWWHLKRKRNLYIDGFAPKSHRALMQFLLIPQNTRARFEHWEDDFRDVLAFIEIVPAPRYPGPIDAELAARGRPVFERSCAECHGSYGERPSYPERIVPIGTVGTDRVRLDALKPEDRRAYAESWFARGADPATIDPGGYVAPPLDGVWVSGPYFHNGSVPTLWHVLHPEARPIVWRREGEQFDHERVGPRVRELTELPWEVRLPVHRRRYYDTRERGHSAAGHDFPAALDEDERRAVLEYLKTL